MCDTGTYYNNNKYSVSLLLTFSTLLLLFYSLFLLKIATIIKLFSPSPSSYSHYHKYYGSGCCWCCKCYYWYYYYYHYHWYFYYYYIIIKIDCYTIIIRLFAVAAATYYNLYGLLGFNGIPKRKSNEEQNLPKFKNCIPDWELNSQSPALQAETLTS